jgi:hypothetical protein
LPPLEAWEKVFLGNEAYFDTFHASVSCITCHGGNEGTDDMNTAHEGMVRDPDPMQACGQCHAQTVESFQQNSLHWDLGGFLAVLSERSDEAHWPQVLEAYENHCATCHTSCGQCHVSRPTNGGGGLLDGHVFKSTPPPYTTCTGCHGSRVENEYKGKNEDEEGTRYPADVHYNPGGMNCNDCHSSDEMHGVQGDADHRYEGMETPSCTDAGCHENVGQGDGIELHDSHTDKLSCQACHSIAYKNCYNCHVAQSEEGTPYFKTDDAQMLFLIGRNPIQSDERPWEYVPLRHVPVAQDTFAYYGDDLLPNFDNRSTWTYATPHNIQRITPQNQDCQSCHDSDVIFLTSDKVAQAELDANALVITDQVFPHPGLSEAKYAIPQACVACHPQAVEGSWELVSEHIHSLNYVIEPKGDVILCSDCHAEDGNFDWAAAGYSAEQAAQFIWSDYPNPKSSEQPSDPLWVIGVGLGVVAVAATPMVLERRANRRKAK